MDKAAIQKYYQRAAIAAGGIIAALVLYPVIVEFLSRSGYKAPLTATAAYTLKYALYILATSALVILKFTGRSAAEVRANAMEAVTALTKTAIIRAAICELPAACGLALFILTGSRGDFYMLLIFAIALEIYHFPRLHVWEERLRSDLGQLPQ